MCLWDQVDFRRPGVVSAAAKGKKNTSLDQKLQTNTFTSVSKHLNKFYCNREVKFYWKKFPSRPQMSEDRVWQTGGVCGRVGQQPLPSAALWCVSVVARQHAELLFADSRSGRPLLISRASGLLQSTEAQRSGRRITELGFCSQMVLFSKRCLHWVPLSQALSHSSTGL